MNLNWNTQDHLLPAIVQNAETKDVLMLGYMNSESLAKTQETGLVTFYSRSRQTLWCKGETSGNYLHVVEIKLDCDRDAILILALPKGPTCHRQTNSCFEEPWSFLSELQELIRTRLRSENEESYVSRLGREGLDRITQKVGEEAVETVIASKNRDLAELENESADLLFHLMVLLQYQQTSLNRVVSLLKNRHQTRNTE